MSNVIQFPMDRIKSSSTVTFVDGTGPFVWYSTPSQTDQLEEQMNDILDQAIALEEQSARVLEMMEESFEPL
jgi:hypothetical protein